MGNRLCYSRSIPERFYIDLIWITYAKHVLITLMIPQLAHTHTYTSTLSHSHSFFVITLLCWILFICLLLLLIIKLHLSPMTNGFSIYFFSCFVCLWRWMRVSVSIFALCTHKSNSNIFAMFWLQAHQWVLSGVNVLAFISAYRRLCSFFRGIQLKFLCRFRHCTKLILPSEIVIFMRFIHMQHRRNEIIGNNRIMCCDAARPLHFALWIKCPINL